MKFKPANDRGFLIGEFKDEYGLKCTLQKSSLATDDCIWLGIHEIDAKIFNGIGFGHGWQPYPIPPNVQISTRMHLTRKMVADLLPALQHFVETGELPPNTDKRICEHELGHRFTPVEQRASGKAGTCAKCGEAV